MLRYLSHGGQRVNEKAPVHSTGEFKIASIILDLLCEILLICFETVDKEDSSLKADICR